MAFVEKRMNIKFCVRLGKTVTMCTVVIRYREHNEWHRHFKEGRESVEDDGRSGRPQTCRTSENIEKISTEIRKKRLQK
ncbi:hypothetical protein TNCV_1424011 [Trichonephila clavipes]|nr:hypothetical protein TNCV_1424011 [Trichonephila clavipes]